MLTSSKVILGPLLESADGVHLTAYLVNQGDLIDLKSQLQECINQAYECLYSVMSKEERNKFLKPLDALLLDARTFRHLKGNIGLFRKKDFFRVLNIPVEVEQSCHIATSFHVKPLFRWLQTDQEFLLLGIDNQSAHIYQGSQDSLRLVDSILFPEGFVKRNAADRKIKEAEVFVWLNDWVLQLTRHSKPKLFVAGDRSLVANLNLKYRNAIKTAVSNSFCEHDVAEICTGIRKLLKEESVQLFEKALLEFQFAEDGKRARKNIFQISKAVVEGRVRKLIVTDEISIFGKIDRKSGQLVIHPFDLDHEDDDILDDLAQMVLSQGGEVIIAALHEIPNGRPILAILDDDTENFEKSNDVDRIKVLEERFG